MRYIFKRDNEYSDHLSLPPRNIYNGEFWILHVFDFLTI